MDRSKVDEIIGEIRRLLREVEAERGILFGSWARGEALDTSDVDLIVISRKFEGVPFPRRLVEVQKHWRLPLMLEALPYTPEEFQRLSKERSILRRALEEGIEIRPEGQPSEDER